jgi:hypothetical protein
LKKFLTSAPVLAQQILRSHLIYIVMSLGLGLVVCLCRMGV